MYAMTKTLLTTFALLAVLPTAAAEPPAPACPAECKAATARTVIALINDLAVVGFDESALTGERKHVVEALAKALPELGVTRVVVEAHVGRFCTRSGKGRDVLAPANLPARKCGSMTDEYALAIGERMALSVSRLITEATGGKVAVETLSYGAERPRASYPDEGTGTAGQWNEAARQNNRVEVVVK